MFVYGSIGSYHTLTIYNASDVNVSPVGGYCANFAGGQNPLNSMLTTISFSVTTQIFIGIVFANPIYLGSSGTFGNTTLSIVQIGTK
jgi:hypothetical protein